MKKILVLPSWYPNKTNFSGSFFKEQAAFLNANGYNVKILIAEELHTKSYLFQKLKRFFTGQFRALSKNFLLQEPEAFSFPVIIQKDWTEAKKINRLEKGYLKAYKTFESTIWRPDLIHVQGAYKAGFLAKEILDKFQVPYVTIEHSPFEIASYSNFMQHKIMEVLMKANKVAGVSHYHKRRIEDAGINRSVEVVWNLMDENEFQLKPNVSSNKFVITCIARPVKVKGMNTFFKAIIKFLNNIDDIPSVEINIVGHGSIEENKFVDLEIFDKLENKEQILNTMKFFSFMARDKISSLMQCSDVLVATSTIESYGVAIREAMLCGTPVISTKSGGPEDSIIKETGVLVDIDDFESIAYYLKKIKDKELTFDYSYIRNYVINQSGRKAFKKRMNDFYNCNL